MPAQGISVLFLTETSTALKEAHKMHSLFNHNPSVRAIKATGVICGLQGNTAEHEVVSQGLKRGGGQASRDCFLTPFT